MGEDGQHRGLYALDGYTSQEKWRWSIPSSGSCCNAITGGPVVGGDGTVYVTGNDSKLYAIDGVTGGQKWSIPAPLVYGGGWVGPAIGAYETLVIPAYLESKVYAVDGRGGLRKWEFTVQPGWIDSPIIYGTSTAFVATAGGMYALDPATGVERWRFSAPSSLGEAALGADGTVYVGSRNGTNVYALSGDIGLPKWLFDAQSPISGSPALGPDGTLYFCTGDGHVYAVDSANGQKKWAVAGISGAVSPALTEDGTLYVARNGGISALKATNGVREWSFHNGTRLMTTAPCVGLYGTIYVAQADPGLYTLVVYAVEGSGLPAEAPWPQFRGNSRHTGACCAPPLVQAPPGDVNWRVQVNTGPGYSPTLGPDGIVYVGETGGKLRAFNGGSGQEKWDVDALGPIATSPTAGSDGTVYVTSLSSNLYAIEGATGKQRWVFRAGGRLLTSPSLAPDGTLYLGVSDSNVYAVIGASGQEKWRFPVTDPNFAAAPVIDAGGNVLVEDGPNIYALAGATGQQRWGFTAQAKVTLPLAIGPNGTVYVSPGTGDTRLYALDGLSGAKKWALDLPDGASGSPAIGPDGTLYIGSGDGVRAADAAIGQPLWVFALGAGSGAYGSPALSADGTVYIGQTDAFNALDAATGRKKWRLDTGAHSQPSSPTIGQDGTVYFIAQANGGGGYFLYSVVGSAVLAEAAWPKIGADFRNTGSTGASRGPASFGWSSQEVRAWEHARVVLSAAPNGAWPSSYQWFFQGNALQASTNGFLMLPDVSTNQTGEYTVSASNALGRALSPTIHLVVGYGLAVTSSGQGAVQVDPVQAVYTPGSQVNLTAVASGGDVFQGWSGDAAGQANPLTVTMDSPKVIAAKFGQPPVGIWTSRNSGTTRGLAGVAFGAGQFVAVGNEGVVLTSPDGAVWTQRALSGLGYFWASVAYGANRFVAVGEGSIVSVSSPDATAWTIYPVGLDTSLRSIAYGSGRFVAVGRAGGFRTILTSPDGATWTVQVHDPGDEYACVTHAAEGFVAAYGSAGSFWPPFGNVHTNVVQTSPDGLTWINRNTAFGDVQAATYGNGQYVLVGLDLYFAGGGGVPVGPVWTSADGTNWSGPTIQTRCAGLTGVAAGAGQFVAVAASCTPSVQTAIMTSPDGINWTHRVSGTTDTLTGVAYGNGSFVAIGTNGTILQSAQITLPGPILGPVRLLSGGVAQVSLVGLAGETYPIQCSTNLTNWRAITNLTLGTNSSGQFIDPAASNYSRRFYRALAP